MALTSLFCIDPAAFSVLISAKATKNEVCARARARVCDSVCLCVWRGRWGVVLVTKMCVSPTSCESDRNEKKRKDKELHWRSGKGGLGGLGRHTDAGVWMVFVEQV